MEEKEIWKAIIVDGEVYEGYEVSNYGRVRSLNFNKTGKIQVMKPSVHNCGYLEVSLYKGGKLKRCKVHRLVATAFVPNDDIKNKTDVNHIDENKQNNRIENLEWCTRKYNINHGTRNERMAKTRSKKVRCVETDIVYESAYEVERKLGLNQSGICECCNGNRKSCGGYHWEYVN